MSRCVIVSTLLDVPGLFFTASTQLLTWLKQNTGRWTAAADLHVTPPNVLFSSRRFQFPSRWSSGGKTSEPTASNSFSRYQTGMTCWAGAFKRLGSSLRLEATQQSKVHFCASSFPSSDSTSPCRPSMEKPTLTLLLIILSGKTVTTLSSANLLVS